MIAASPVAASRPKPAHWRQHLERKAREEEARRTGREYRQAQREAALAAQPTKVCTGCKQPLPLSAFSPKGAGKLNSRCRPCHSAKVAADKRAKRAAMSPEELAAKREGERAEYYSRTGREGQSGTSLEDRRQANANERKAQQTLSGTKSNYPAPAPLPTPAQPPASRSPLIPLKDGTFISVGELARRHWENQKRYRFPRFDQRWR